MFKPVIRVKGVMPYTEIPKIRAIFNEVDTDASGSLSTDELQRLLLKFSISLSDREIGALKEKMDADGSGLIEFQEFVMWFPTLLQLRQEARVFNATTMADAKVRMAEMKVPCKSGGGRGRNNPIPLFKTSVNWKHINSMLPHKKNDEIQKTRREQLFAGFDGNANGFLSLAEVDKGMRDVLKLPELFNIKPVIMRAFQASKNAHVHTKTRNRAARNGGWRPGKVLAGEDYVERSEFRLLLKYLRQYFELFLMFEEMDGSDGLDVDDRRVSLSEFKHSHSLLVSWGLPPSIQQMDPTDLFKQIDKDGHGMILFAEFADWALKMTLDLQDDDDDDE